MVLACVCRRTPGRLQGVLRRALELAGIAPDGPRARGALEAGVPRTSDGNPGHCLASRQRHFGRRPRARTAPVGPVADTERPTPLCAGFPGTSTMAASQLSVLVRTNRAVGFPVFASRKTLGGQRWGHQLAACRSRLVARRATVAQCDKIVQPKSDPQSRGGHVDHHFYVPFRPSCSVSSHGPLSARLLLKAALHTTASTPRDSSPEDDTTALGSLTCISVRVWPFCPLYGHVRCFDPPPSRPDAGGLHQQTITLSECGRVWREGVAAPCWLQLFFMMTPLPLPLPHTHVPILTAISTSTIPATTATTAATHPHHKHAG